MTEQCYICKKNIPDKNIPKEAKNKIGIQLFWHEDCYNKLYEENKEK